MPQKTGVFCGGAEHKKIEKQNKQTISDMIDTSKKYVIESKFTKYEIARILGARALQISMNAPVLLNITKEKLEFMHYDPLKIAELELYEGVLPITVKRPLPTRSAEKIIPKAKVEAEEEKKEEKEKKAEKVEQKPEGKEEKEHEEKKEEEAIIKETAGTEVMELATPEDEVETEQNFEAEAGEE